MMLHGKVALVTGAARGIGRAICERYAREGAFAFVTDVDEAGARAVADGIGERAAALALDVTRPESIEAAMAAAAARTGRLDILVNNAGVFDLAPIVEITRDSYHRVFDINVEGLLFMLQAGAKQMIAPGATHEISLAYRALTYDDAPSRLQGIKTCRSRSWDSILLRLRTRAAPARSSTAWSRCWWSPCAR